MPRPHLTERAGYASSRSSSISPPTQELVPLNFLRRRWQTASSPAPSNQMVPGSGTGTMPAFGVIALGTAAPSGLIVISATLPVDGSAPIPVAGIVPARSVNTENANVLSLAGSPLGLPIAGPLKRTSNASKGPKVTSSKSSLSANVLFSVMAKRRLNFSCVGCRSRERNAIAHSRKHHWIVRCVRRDSISLLSSGTSRRSRPA